MSKQKKRYSLNLTASKVVPGEGTFAYFGRPLNTRLITMRDFISPNKNFFSGVEL